MESTGNKITDKNLSIRKTARVAGLMYLLIILSSLLVMIIGPFKYIIPDNEIETFNNIVANEFLFRIGAAYDLLMYVSVIILSVALYAVLKTVNKTLAMLALLWRLAEAIVGCLIVISSLIIFILIGGDNYLEAFGATKIQTHVSLLRETGSVALSIVFVFLSLGTIINCLLFYKSRYIPRILAGFGILAFLLLLIFSVYNILQPVDELMIFGAPAILFEIIIGFWLLIGSVKIERRLKEVPETDEQNTINIF